MGASAVLKLQKVGFTVEQVEALADFMDLSAASKADLAGTRSDLMTEVSTVRSDLMSEIAAVRSDLMSEIAAVRAEAHETKAELKADIAAVRADMRHLELHLTIKFGAMMVIAVGILLTAIRTLPFH